MASRPVGQEGHCFFSYYSDSIRKKGSLVGRHVMSVRLQLAQCYSWLWGAKRKKRKIIKSTYCQIVVTNRI